MPGSPSTRPASAGIVHVIDFMFPEVEAWQQARALLDEGAIGRLTHFAYTWRIETYASRTGADTWKTRTIEGGGALGNFGSHVFYNIEWLLEPVTRLRRSRRLWSVTEPVDR